jgi:glycosyltransferase involved in cell wall biosynthesis
LIKFAPLFLVRVLRGKIKISLSSPHLKKDVIHYISYDFFVYIFARSIIQYNPKIIHAHDFSMVPVAVHCAKKNKAKVIFDAHEIEFDREGRNSKHVADYIDNEIHKYFKLIDGFVATNQSAMNFFIDRYKIRPKEVAVIYNTPIIASRNINQPVDKIKDIRQRLDLPEKKTLLVYIGDIGRNRGVEEIVEALSNVDNVDLCIIGPQNEKNLQRFNLHVEKLNMNDRIHILPPVPHWQVTETIKTADASIMFTKPTCLNHIYSSPNKLFEAALAGLPIIAPDLPEMKRLIEDMKVGVTTEAENIEKLTASIKTVLADTQLYRPNTEQLDTIRAKYSWRAQKEKLVDLYQRILNTA